MWIEPRLGLGGYDMAVGSNGFGAGGDAAEDDPRVTARARLQEKVSPAPVLRWNPAPGNPFDHCMYDSETSSRGVTGRGGTEEAMLDDAPADFAARTLHKRVSRP